MCSQATQTVVACELGSRPPVLVAAVKAMTFAGIQVQAYGFDPETGRGTGYFVTDDPDEARAALENAGLPAELVTRELNWTCRPPASEDAEPPAA